MKLRINSINYLLNKYKIVPIVSSFVLGIILNEYVEYPWILAATLGLVSIFASILFRTMSFLLFIPLGLAFSANSQLMSEDNILGYTNEKIEVEGILYRSPESREEGTRIYLDSQYIIKDGLKEKVSGKVIIYSDEKTQSLAYGDKVRFLDIKLSPIENYNNPGAFNLKRFYKRQNIHARGFVEGADQIISFGLSESYSSILHYIDSLRIKYGNFAREHFPSPQSAVLNALTIGEKRGIPQGTRTEFSKAGVAHVLAISGLHVGAIAIAFFLLIKWILKRSEFILLKYQVPRLAATLTIVPIFLYTAVAGFSTSTVRAFIMISLYLISIAIGKQEHRLNTLCAAALIILLWHPWSLFELSFQLSFSAVFAILIAHKFYPFKFQTLEDKFYSLLKTTVAATLITFPLVANSFGILPLVSIPANLTLVPLVEFVIVPISLISFIGFLVSPYVAELLMSLNIFFIDMLLYGVRIFLEVPYSSSTIPPMNLLSWIAFSILVLTLVANSAYPKLRYLLPFILIGLIATLVYPLPGKSGDGVLRITFLDGGDSRSIVLAELPDNNNILIIGGQSKSTSSGYIEKKVVTNYLLNRGIRKIALFILTSVDKDHLNGALHLTEKFSVQEMYTNSDRLSGALWGSINDKEISWDNLSRINTRISMGDAVLEIFGSGENFVVEDTRLPLPIAFRLTYGKSSFLFGEGLNNNSFQKVLFNSYKYRINSVVLYIPDINTASSTNEIIEIISPEVMVTREMGDFVKENEQIDILSTDEVGAVTITSDGEQIQISSFANEKELILH